MFWVFKECSDMATAWSSNFLATLGAVEKMVTMESMAEI